MLGKLLNYATDNLLPEKYKYIGDYACAGLDVATGDYASAGIGVIEGASQNLKQMGYDEGATTLNLVSKTAGVASGDINNFIKTGSGDSFILAGAKMCAVGSATSIGAVKNGQRGANIANSLAAGSIGNSIEETALKSGLTSTGALIGYQKKGEEGILIGASLTNSSANLVSDSKNIAKNEKFGFDEAKRIKQDTTAVAKDAKELSEDNPKTKKQLREKIKEEQTFELLDKSTDATITSAQIAAERSSENTDNFDKIVELSGEIGHSINAACRIRQTRIEIEDKTYKITDTLCYTADNYKNLKREFERTNGNSD